MNCTRCGQAIWMETIPKLVATVEAEDDTVSEEETAETEATTEAPITEPEKRGCRSVIGSSACALVTVLGLGACAVTKKKRKQ